MNSSLFFHILSILLLSCAVHYTCGLSCFQGMFVNGKPEDPDNPPKDTPCNDTTHICMAVQKTEPSNVSVTHGCIAPPDDLKCVNDVNSTEGQLGNLGPAFCDTDGCNGPAFLPDSCKGSGGGGGGGGGAGMLCWQGQFVDDKPVDPNLPPNITACAKAGEICMVAQMTGADKKVMVIHACTAKPGAMTCNSTVDSDEGRKGNIGPAFCDKDGCNTKVFLMENCKGKGPGPGPGPGPITPPPNSSQTAHYTHAPSYFKLFMAYAVILTIAGVINKKNS